VGLPTPPDVTAVKLSETPTSVCVEFTVAEAASFGLTVTDTEADVAVELPESVTLTVAVNVPLEVYV